MQIVGYEPSGGGSALLVSDGEQVTSHSLAAGSELRYSLGRRLCAGVIDQETGRHRPCDRPETPHCAYHTSSWICARCTGTCLKDEMDCFEEHAIYLAAFAPNTFKVGVTRSWRLETRLREQGADRAAHVATVSDGRIAREREAEIARDLVDRVGIETKIDGLAADLDHTAWESLLAGYDVIDRYTFEYGLDLERRPVRETIAAGTVRGLKGRVLVLERRGTTYAVDLRDLVGYELVAGEGERSLQSSLGSFE